MFSRMETVYKLLYSLIGVQWKCYNMIAERNLLHFLMEREEVRHSLSEVQAVLWLVELWVHGVGKPALLCMPWRQRQRNLVKQHLRLDLGLHSIRNILKHIRNISFWITVILRSARLWHVSSMSSPSHLWCTVVLDFSSDIVTWRPGDK